MALFADREAAGNELAEALAEAPAGTPAGTPRRWRGTKAVVLGIPRGGVVVAARVARTLGLPLGVVVVRKLGAPAQEEFAVGAIAEGVRVVIPDAVRATGTTSHQLSSVEDLERAELRRRQRAFAAGRLELRGRTVIIVDDGVATGATAVAACRSVRADGAEHVVLAVPVAPWDWLPGADADEFVCPHRERHFWAVGQFYDDFTQTTDDEVARLLSPR
jgi:putative phosphoribosyl transferase